MDIRSTTAVKLTLILFVAVLGISSADLFGRSGLATKAAAADFGQRSGAAVYSQMCVRCHGSDGRAKTPKGKALGATDLTSNDWSPDTARDTRIVTRGKEDMPAFKAKLTPAEIDAVVAYIRRFKN